MAAVAVEEPEDDEFKSSRQLPSDSLSESPYNHGLIQNQ